MLLQDLTFVTLSRIVDCKFPLKVLYSVSMFIYFKLPSSLSFATNMQFVNK